ncbi:MAG: 2-oxoglutarate dehydrogenase complex dihydrolipoyllysine-residue succinyltransferase [Chlamydiales bacterium]|nr:2-oxoglutarate dehydrogenase complex dihydrolipoyllysine-residue succinyltransferase [Chlamydiales bacterium]
MSQDIKVPAMGESINEATIAEIIKQSGSAVAVDDEILELETDKVNQVLHAPIAGTLKLTVNKDDVVKIGQVIGVITPSGERQEAPVADVAAPEPAKEEVRKVETAPAAPAPKAAAPKADFSARASRESFIADLSKPKEESPPKQESPKTQSVVSTTSGARPERRVRMSKIRKVIARRLVESQQTTAMLTTFNEVDMSEVMAVRERHKDSFMKQHGVKLGFMSFFVKACVSALKAVPELNAYIDGEDVVYRDYFNVSIAIGTDRGLVVPVVRNCDQLSYAEIEQAIVNYAKKAREGGLTVDDLQGGGFTITNGGTYGSLLSTPIINPPQSGILGMHKIQKRPIVVNDQIVIRPMMYLALSYDHRIVDGKEAVTFLVHVKNDLEDPSRLLLGLDI